jgi:DNA polymerase II small subunit
MLDAQEITYRFLDTRLQVHPEVVRYILEQGDDTLIDRIIAGIPPETIVVSAKHIPGIRPTREARGSMSSPRSR